jgi:predicted RNase H-like HicB family nuclease
MRLSPHSPLHGPRSILVDVRRADGRWIAEVPELPGVMVYGDNRDAVLVKVLSLAYTVLGDEVQHGGSSSCGSRSDTSA